MKLFTYQRLKDGERFPHNVLIAMGTHGVWKDTDRHYEDFYIQFQSPFRKLESFRNFMLNKQVTDYRRRTLRLMLRLAWDKMSDL